ncbi:MAG: YdhK family protein [Bacillota bacterium]|nr:YdhK family protein [Bacillota bacterium]
MEKRKLLGILTMAAAITLSGCAAGENDEATPNNNQANNSAEENSHQGGHGDHSGMDMSGSGEVREGLKEKENPTFEVGSNATITHAHMPGMEGAEATIVGAYETTVYAISYDPTDGGERVENHKWIIHEEVKEAQNEPYQVGDEVEVGADHMEGMQGATATIDSAEQTTVYMVDFTLTDSGEEVTNHKWVTESELSTEE